MTHNNCTLIKNLKKVKEDIVKYSKNPNQVTLLAVSKYACIESIQTIFGEGINNFSENFIQVAMPKIAHLSNKIIWHYTGVLQSNKLKIIAKNFNWIHSLSSFSHAIKLNNYCKNLTKSMNVLIQVNIDMDPQKKGIMPGDHGELSKLLLFIVERCEYLNLKGFSCMLANTRNHTLQRKSFMKMHGLKNDTKKIGIKIEYLSMGTSSDIGAALLSGSTIIRVGRAIFSK